jgi:HAD superfamily hydrolase (TIGR01549 family)
MVDSNKKKRGRNLHILWDFDGTLFDTYPMYTEIFKKVIGPSATYEEIYHELKKSFTHAKEAFALTQSQVAEFHRLEEEWPLDEILPFPYVENVLKRTNVNVIMTHKPRKDVEYLLYLHKLERYFSEIVAGDDGFPRKPNSASYRYLHEIYELDLVVGDRQIDFIPAKEIGIRTCSFQNPIADADFHVSSYQEFDFTVKS